MSYVSDRQRIERMLFPMLAQNVVASGADDPNSPDARKAFRAFGQAMEEAVSGLDEKKRYSLIRRGIRLHEELVGPFKEAEARVDKVGLIMYYLLSWAIESGYLVLHDGTAMSQGLDLLLPAMEHSANISPLTRSAHKAATKLLQALQKEGYFRGVIALDYVQ